MTYRVKFVTGEQDTLVNLQPTDTVAALVQQVRHAKGIADGKHIRIISGGKELYADDVLSKAASKVLHCMVTDILPPPRQPPPKKPPPVVQPPEQPPVDWLDMVDPGTVLMWIFGSILALLWLLYLFYAHMFDRTSLLMLYMMTVAFLIPCALSYIPWPSFLQPQPLPQPHPQPQPGGGQPDLAVGRSTSVAPAAAAPGAWQRHVSNSDGIPPRPPARVQAGM